MKLFDMQ